MSAQVAFTESGSSPGPQLAFSESGNSPPKTTQFYSYLWIREKDGTFPAGALYYAGKGTNGRAFSRHGHRCNPPKDPSNILIFPQANEAAAFESEAALIALFGRANNGTGCLRNLTDGGEGTSGAIFTETRRQRTRETNTGRFYSEETRKKIGAASKGRRKRKYPPCSQAARHHFRYAGGTQCNCGCTRAWKASRKRSEAAKSRPPISEETRRKLSAAGTGRKKSEETRRKLREVQRKPYVRYVHQGQTYKIEARAGEWVIVQTMAPFEQVGPAFPTAQIAEAQRQRCVKLARRRVRSGATGLEFGTGDFVPKIDQAVAQSARSHRQWHVNRGIVNPNCKLCQEAALGANDAIVSKNNP